MMTPLLIAHTSLLYQIPVALLIVACALFWHKRHTLIDSPPQLWLMLFLAIGSATTLLNNPSWSGFWGISWLSLAGSAALLPHNREDRQGLLLLTLWIVIEGAIRLVAKMAGQYWLWLTPDQYAWRLVLFFGDWGGWTGLLAIAAPAALLHVRSWRRVALALALTFILFWSGSRGAWFAALAAALVALVIARGRGWQLLGCNVLVFGLLFVFAGDLLFADRGGVQVGMTQSTGRDLFATVAWEQFLRHPIAGNGLGSYSLAQYGLDGIYHPHNWLLSILHDMGLAGAAAGIGYVWSLRSGLRRARQHIVVLVALGVWGMFMAPIMAVQVLVFWYLGGIYETK